MAVLSNKIARPAKMYIMDFMSPSTEFLLRYFLGPVRWRGELKQWTASLGAVGSGRKHNGLWGLVASAVGSGGWLQAQHWPGKYPTPKSHPHLHLVLGGRTGACLVGQEDTGLTTEVMLT